MGHRTVKVDEKISEGMFYGCNKQGLIGGYAFVYRVTDQNTFAQYALKKIYISGAAAKEAVEKEVKIWVCQ